MLARNTNKREGHMRQVIYRVHYKLRRWGNFLLYHTVQRWHHGRKLLAHGPMIAYLNFSRAAIGFVLRQEQDQILQVVSGLPEGGVVLDVGGDTGDWAMDLQTRYAPQLYIFEPNRRSVETLRQRFARTTARILPFGLGAVNEVCQLSDDGMGYSVYDASRNYSAATKYEIQIRDAREVFEELALGEVDLLKINIEGGEYSLLPRLMESGLIERCRMIRVQFHDWFPDAFALRRRIVKALARTHDVEWSYPMVWESWIRRESRP